MMKLVISTKALCDQKDFFNTHCHSKAGMPPENKKKKLENYNFEEKVRERKRDLQRERDIRTSAMQKCM